MSRPELPDLASLPADHMQWVSVVCDEFEDHWGRGDRPTIQEYMRRAAEDACPAARLVLLRELLTSERELRERDAKARDIDAYRVFFNGPGESDVVDFVLGDEAKADGRRRFEIVKSHAEGGLGEVFIAHDRHLDRNVALKKIKPELADDGSSRNRFMGEAEITGQLEHPNIAPVYSLGLDHDRLPFYAMRFIEGQTLGEAIAKFRKDHPAASEQGARLLGLRKLLGKFNAVCDAVAFAHSRGILHRDIKPANIVLGQFGEAILVDWGLAKKIGDPDSDSVSGPARQREHESERMTEHGSVLGTLPYMSPEQARSATGPLRPASDIYSLGATLYHLLTGRPPFAGDDPEELRRAVIQGGFSPPREVDPAVPRALEAIVLKAMARELGDRYATATALAEDVEHWLADEPATGWREPLSTRVGRMLRRHRTLVFSTAAALIVGLMGLAGFSMAIAGKNRELERQRREAEDQRDRAEHARDLAVSAVQAIVSPTKDQMLSEEARPFRATLLDEGLRLSREMIQVAAGDPRAARVRTQALMTEAEILVEKGERDRASEVWKQAIDLFEGLVARDPGDIENRDGLARLLFLHVKLVTDPETRRSNLRRSNEIYKGLLREHPRAQNSDGWTWFLSSNLHNIGHSYFMESMSMSTGNSSKLLERAIESFREGVGFCEERVKKTGRRAGLLRALAANEVYLFRAYRMRGRAIKDPHESAKIFNGAIEWGKKAIADSRALLDQDKTDYFRGVELSLAQSEVGLHYLDAGPSESAIPYFKDARETLKAMVAAHGKVVSRVASLQEFLAVVNHNLTMAYDQANFIRYHSGPRRDATREAYEICDKLGLVKPLSQDLRRIYAHRCVEMADYQEDDGEKPDLNLFFTAERLWNEILKENPQSDEARGTLVLVRLELADELTARGRLGEASQWRSRAPSTARGKPELFYELAVLFSSSAETVGTYPTKLNPQQRDARRGRYKTNAISMLHEAITDGFKDLKRVRAEPTFTPLRTCPEFKALELDILFLSAPFAPL